MEVKSADELLAVPREKRGEVVATKSLVVSACFKEEGLRPVALQEMKALLQGTESDKTFFRELAEDCARRLGVQIKQ